MRNTPAFPVLALIMASLLAGIGAVSYASGSAKPVVVLSSIEIGLTAWAFALGIYGIQGLVSVLLEGRELRPGLGAPRSSGWLSIAIVLFSLLLAGIAPVLGWGIVAGWQTRALGLLAGAGCLDLALLLILYKEAFLGDEVRLDERDDGLPW